ncbi:MAG: regulatory protein RecX [Candidatus Zixiibacteriota bacterium]|nr:MAG: regulatory protein RecX [candidate division Zixibacteria bacterium]
MAELIITGLEPVKRKKGWFELVARGKPPFYIYEETIYKNSLKVGDILSESRLKQIKEQADRAWLKYRAFQILSRRTVPERELRRKLTAERKSSGLRDEVILWLKQYGYIDDFRYACAYIRSQSSGGGKSRLYLKKKLFEKGINGDTSELALDTELVNYDEDSIVLELSRKKLKSLKDEKPLKVKQRLSTFLRSRGFGWDSINKTISTLINDNPDLD